MSKGSRRKYKGHPREHRKTTGSSSVTGSSSEDDRNSYRYDTIPPQPDLELIRENDALNAMRREIEELKRQSRLQRETEHNQGQIGEMRKQSLTDAEESQQRAE